MTCASGERGKERKSFTMRNAKSWFLLRSCSGVMLAIHHQENHKSQLAIHKSLPVYLSEHNIDTADGRYHISDQASFAHLR